MTAACSFAQKAVGSLRALPAFDEQVASAERELLELVRSNQFGQCEQSPAVSASQSTGNSRALEQLKQAASSGVEARTAVYGQWMRALQDDPQLAADYKLAKGPAVHLAFFQPHPRKWEREVLPGKGSFFSEKYTTKKET